MSCLVLSCRVLSCLVLSCLVLSPGPNPSIPQMLLRLVALPYDSPRCAAWKETRVVVRAISVRVRVRVTVRVSVRVRGLGLES
jgi:hypothetical protein